MGIAWNKGMKFPYKARPNQKGKIPWNKGKKIHYPVWNKGLKGWNLGHSVSEQTKIKIGAKGKITRTGMKFSETHKQNISKALRNKPKTREHALKVGEAHKGEKSRFWRGGVTPENKLLRRSLIFRLWREAVFKRDDWTCVWCKERGGVLHPDHIKMFADYPKLRFELSNGQTLCKLCHIWKTKWDMRIYRGKVPELNFIRTGSFEK